MVSLKRQLKRVAENIVATIAPLTWSTGQGTRLLVLMYHRVLPAEHPDRATEQPGMFVSPTTLDMHLATLRQRFEMVFLDDWLKKARAKQPLPRMACAVTFDDGWRDNYEYAFPVLQEHRIPATIFLVSGLVGTEQEFWPNRLARLLANRSGRPLTGQLAQLLTPAPSSWSQDEIDRAIGLLKPFNDMQCQKLIEEQEQPYGQSASGRALLNQDEIRIMAASGLVRFGSHTQTHLRCREDVPAEALRREIVDSRDDVAAVVGAPAELFCYPNGETTPSARELVSQTYLGAVTTRTGWHSPGEDQFLIKRTGLHEDVSNRRAALLARISGWL